MAGRTRYKWYEGIQPLEQSASLSMQRISIVKWIVWGWIGEVLPEYHLTLIDLGRWRAGYPVLDLDSIPRAV
jgi:hypothetical protein